MICKGVKHLTNFMEEGYVLFQPDLPVYVNIQAIEDTTIYYIDPSDIDYMSYMPTFNGLTLILLQGQWRALTTFKGILHTKLNLNKVELVAGTNSSRLIGQFP